MITFRTANEIRESKDGDKTIAIINSKALDRHGTVIDPAGVNLANYSRNPVFLINHNYDMLAGNGAAIRYQDDKLIAEVPDEAWDKEDAEVMRWYRKVKSGKMKMTSIGFTYDYDDMEEEERMDEQGNTIKVPVIRKSELLEFSFVSVGSNPEALVLSRTANEQTMEMIKELKQEMKQELSGLIDKVSQVADRDYLRNIVEDYFERYLPRTSDQEKPGVGAPVPESVSRTDLISQEAMRIVNQLKIERGQR